MIKNLYPGASEAESLSECALNLVNLQLSLRHHGQSGFRDDAVCLVEVPGRMRDIFGIQSVERASNFLGVSLAVAKRKFESKKQATRVESARLHTPAEEPAAPPALPKPERDEHPLTLDVPNRSFG